MFPPETPLTPRHTDDPRRPPDRKRNTAPPPPPQKPVDPFRYELKKKPKPPPKYEDDSGDIEYEEDTPAQIIIKILFVIAGIGIIIAIIRNQPEPTTWVCDRHFQSRGSPLTAFGSCRPE